MENIKISKNFVLDEEVGRDARWGYIDTKFYINHNERIAVTGNRYSISGYEMPYFIPFLEDILQTPFNRDIRKEKPISVPKPKKNNEFVKMVQKKFNTQLVFDDYERFEHSHGQATADEVNRALYYGTLNRIADAVFYCVKQTDVSQLMKLANKYNVCLVPYGGGTNVSCALMLPASEKRMIVVVDFTTLSKIISVDKKNNRVVVEAGIVGIHLEQQLNTMGYTLGHEPDSIEFSTVGGWIATNASGMKKNRYGNIEDLVENYTLITPTGTLELNATHARISGGVLLHKALIGNEGNFGFIVQATLKIFKLPQIKKYESIVFPDLHTGIQFLQDLQDTQMAPASIRLVDNLQFQLGRALRKEEKGFAHILKHKLQQFILTKIKKYDLRQLAAATIVFEGSKESVQAQKKTLSRLLKVHDGMFGGAENGKRGYMLTFAIAYIRDFMSEHYVLGETYETTVPWDKIEEVYAAVQKRSLELHKKYKFPGTCFVSGRITQLYQSGVCVYFTHGLCYKGISKPEEKFAILDRELRKTIMDHGGSISHHHGIGKIRADFAHRLYSNETIKVLKSIKKEVDPKNIMGIQNNVFYKDVSPK